MTPQGNYSSSYQSTNPRYAGLIPTLNHGSSSTAHSSHNPSGIVPQHSSSSPIGDSSSNMSVLVSQAPFSADGSGSGQRIQGQTTYPRCGNIACPGPRVVGMGSTRTVSEIEICPDCGQIRRLPQLPPLLVETLGAAASHTPQRAISRFFLSVSESHLTGTGRDVEIEYVEDVAPLYRCSGPPGSTASTEISAGDHSMIATGGYSMGDLEKSRARAMRNRVRSLGNSILGEDREARTSIVHQTFAVPTGEIAMQREDPRTERAMQDQIRRLSVA